ncbi:MAG: YkgJ family cysteine cluster protein [bacterium]
MGFIISNAVKYTCIQCGVCCRKNWFIGLDDQSYARLVELDWSDKVPELAAKQLFQLLPKPLLTGEQYTFCKIKDTACVFLLPDNRCQIHAQFGFDAKAQVCKEFPFHFMDTPDGTVVGLSFACTAVQQHRGQPVDTQFDEIGRIYQSHYRKHHLKEPITLYSGIDISWSEYKIIESALLQILNDSAYPFETGLIAGSILINVCISMKEVEKMAKQENKPAKETMLGALNKLQFDRFKHIFDIAVKAKTAKKISRGGLAPFISWMEFVSQKQSRFALLFNFYKNYLKYRSGRGNVSTHFTDGTQINLKELDKIEFDLTQPELNKYLRRYFSHVIFRKNLIPAHGVFRGYYTLLAFYGMGKLIAKASAAKHRRTRVELDDLQHAAATLDTEIVLHSQFSRLFTVSPYITLLVDRLYLQPQYPQIIIQ